MRLTRTIILALFFIMLTALVASATPAHAQEETTTTTVAETTTTEAPAPDPEPSSEGTSTARIVSGIGIFGVIIKSAIQFVRNLIPKIDGIWVVLTGILFGTSTSAALDFRAMGSLLEQAGASDLIGRTPHPVLDWVVTGTSMMAVSGVVAELTSVSGPKKRALEAEAAAAEVAVLNHPTPSTASTEPESDADSATRTGSEPVIPTGVSQPFAPMTQGFVGQHQSEGSVMVPLKTGRHERISPDDPRIVRDK